MHYCSSTQCTVHSTQCISTQCTVHHHTAHSAQCTSVSAQFCTVHSAHSISASSHSAQCTKCISAERNAWKWRYITPTSKPGHFNLLILLQRCITLQCIANMICYIDDIMWCNTRRIYELIIIWDSFALFGPSIYVEMGLCVCPPSLRIFLWKPWKSYTIGKKVMSGCARWSNLVPRGARFCQVVLGNARWVVPGCSSLWQVMSGGVRWFQNLSGVGRWS